VAQYTPLCPSVLDRPIKLGDDKSGLPHRREICFNHPYDANAGNAMTPRSGREPKDTSDKPTPRPPVDDDEEDGDIASPKRDRDDEAEMFEKRDNET
jgi:hypothetical protein